MVVRPTSLEVLVLGVALIAHVWPAAAAQEHGALLRDLRFC